MNFFGILLGRAKSVREKDIEEAVRNITGKKPKNVSLYVLALRHSSAAVTEGAFRDCNERMEYLGDAILGAIVADFLFMKFPSKDEGFLTEIRSRVVSRESLNRIAFKLGINDLVEFDHKKKNHSSYKSLYGDAMEAFIGAMYLDRGYEFCKKFIVKKLLLTHLDMGEVVENDQNYKSKLIEWSQKNGKEIKYTVMEDRPETKNHKQFVINLEVDGESLTQGIGFTKKKAEQDASRRACEILEIE
jgi:ribonuclease-3